MRTGQVLLLEQDWAPSMRQAEAYTRTMHVLCLLPFFVSRYKRWRSLLIAAVWWCLALSSRPSSRCGSGRSWALRRCRGLLALTAALISRAHLILIPKRCLDGRRCGSAVGLLPCWLRRWCCRCLYCERAICILQSVSEGYIQAYCMQAHTFFRAGAAPSTAARFLPAGFAGALPAGFAGIPRYNVRNVCADEYYVVNIFSIAVQLQKQY